MRHLQRTSHRNSSNHNPSPPYHSWRVSSFVVMMSFIVSTCLSSQPSQFVIRSNDTLRLGGKPFYFLGANAYYLLEQSARGDTATVNALFTTAQSLGMNVVRTWGFFDSSDSLNPAVVQYRPGVFNERALWALDYVLYQAKLHNIRLLIPLVNSWDDYGGMNQYVRWRSQITTATEKPTQRFSPSDQARIIEGGNGRSYRFAITSQLGHDDFYTDAIIKSWYKNYIYVILNRMNTFTNVRYRDEPSIFGWELANEPRSSDVSSRRIYTWATEISSYIKSIDQNHLVGTGEEGFDVSETGYSVNSYNNQHRLFDGSAGVAFSANSVIPSIDFGSCHLYPESWGLPYNAGNAWIRDHIRIARASRKPLLVGEFGVRTQKAATYDSWLTTALLDGAAGAMAWQLLEGPRTDTEGFGFRCSEEQLLCSRLRNAANMFINKSQNGTLPQPQSFSLQQNYPNPFNGVTTIAYSLPFDAYVELSVFNALGQKVTTVVEGAQSAGERKELLEGESLASGSYFYRLRVSALSQPLRKFYSESKKLSLLK